MGSVDGKGDNGHTRNVLVRTEEVVATAPETNNSRKSVRSFAQDIGVSTSSAWTICHELFFFPYKIDLSQPLLQNGIARRYTCGMLFPVFGERTTYISTTDIYYTDDQTGRVCGNHEILWGPEKGRNSKA
jgi:hypothetical protein